MASTAKQLKEWIEALEAAAGNPTADNLQHAERLDDFHGGTSVGAEEREDDPAGTKSEDLRRRRLPQALAALVRATMKRPEGVPPFVLRLVRPAFEQWKRRFKGTCPNPDHAGGTIVFNETRFTAECLHCQEEGKPAVLAEFLMLLEAGGKRSDSWMQPG